VDAFFWAFLHNEPVGKVLLTSKNDFRGGRLTPPNHEIVDCGAFCEVSFFSISPKNLLGDFFYRLNAIITGATEVRAETYRPSFRVRWMKWLGKILVFSLLVRCQ
jgi:hypothetical protein